MKQAASTPVQSWFWSVALHAGLVAALAFGTSFTRPEQVVPLPIEAVVVDDAVLEALATVRSADARRQQIAAAERERVRREREEQAQIERERQEAEALVRAEAEERRQAELALRQKAEAEARLKAEAAAAAKRKADAVAAAKREADAAAKREADAAARRKAEAERARQQAEERARADREADLKARLAEEERRSAAVSGGLKARYVAMIQARIQRNWIRPGSAQAGLKCIVNVTQIPGGEVVGATLGACNGDDAVRQSIVSAVLRSSPLPAPPDPSLFERNLVIEFIPED